MVPLADHDEPGVFQDLQVTAQVPVGQAENGPQVGEVRLVSLGEHREDSQPGPLMHDIIEGEGGLSSFMQIRISPSGSRPHAPRLSLSGWSSAAGRGPDWH